MIGPISFVETAGYGNIFSYGAVFKVHTDKSSPGYIGHLLPNSEDYVLPEFARKYFILAPDGYIHCVYQKCNASTSPSERYGLYLARTRAKEKLTEEDIPYPYDKEYTVVVGAFSRKDNIVTARNRNIVYLQEIDMSNKPLWLEEWDLAELFQ